MRDILLQKSEQTTATNCEDVMGKHGCGNVNDNGERLVLISLNNNCVIGGTIFPNKNIRNIIFALFLPFPLYKSIKTHSVKIEF